MAGSRPDRRAARPDRRATTPAAAADGAARLVARGLRAAIRLSGRGSGSTLPGRVAGRIAPGFLARARGRLDRVVLVSGTNGKTTTTAMVTAALAADGRRVATNPTGSNLRRGLVTALAVAPPQVQDAVLEVDEAVLPRAAGELAPDVVVLTNLSRDQLDRYHEVRHVAAIWRTAVARLDPAAAVVGVASDPLVAHVAEAAPRALVVELPGTGPGRDAACCPACGGLLAHRALPTCSACGWRPPAPDVRASRAARRLTLARGADQVTATLPVAGVGYAIDAALAWAAATDLGVPPGRALAAIAAVGAVQDRYREVDWEAGRVRLLLAKNPAGFDEALAVAGGERRPAVVSINSGIPDGRDPSWLWDVDMSVLRGRPRVVAAGARALDVALRLKVAGVDCEVRPELDAALRAAGAAGGAVDLFADYTSFQGARRLVAGG